MCCFFLVFAFLGPRIGGAIWWLINPGLWQRAFDDFLTGGNLWWIWPILGLVFLPWTTIMYVIVSPGGVGGWDWLWIGLMLFFDILSYTGGAGRKRVPGYEGY